MKIAVGSDEKNYLTDADDADALDDSSDNDDPRHQGRHQPQCGQGEAVAPAMGAGSI